MIHFQPKARESENINFSSYLKSESCFQALSDNSMLKESKAFVAKNIPVKTKRLIVVGMGGSYVASKAIFEALATNNTIEFWNSIDPQTLEKRIKSINKEDYFLIVSKSGTTVETINIYKKIKQNLIEPKKQIGIISEENEAFLHKEALDNAYSLIAHPKDIGGRFSLFSPVNFVPLAWAGIDLDSFIEGAKKINTNLLGSLQNFLEKHLDYNIKVLWPYSDSLFGFSKWWAQLWSESLGKKNAPKIPFPLICYSSLEQHSLLQHFMEGESQNFYLFFKTNEDSLVNLQCEANMEAMKENGLEIASISLDKIDAFSLGQLMTSFMLVLFASAEKYKINPYGQDGVELSKKILKKKVEK